MEPSADHMKLLLIITAVFEGATGLALLVAPSMAVSTLLAPNWTHLPLWLSDVLPERHSPHWPLHAGKHVTANVMVSPPELSPACSFTIWPPALIVTYAGVGLGLHSALMWPVIVTHIVLAAWCTAILWLQRKPLEFGSFISVS